MTKEKATETLPTRMTRTERALIRRAASVSKLSESRFLVTSALMLGDFKTEEELRAATKAGYQLVGTRLSAIAQVRLLANQIKLLRKELEGRGQVSPEKVEKALDEAASAIKLLGARWHARSAK